MEAASDLRFSAIEMENMGMSFSPIIYRKKIIIFKPIISAKHSKNV